MLVKTFGAAVQGIDATIITIEANVSQGIKFFMVGLPDNAVKESHERILSAFTHNNFKFPKQQVIINLSPADIRKAGSAYDLPIAIGIMAATGELNSESIDDYVIMGELSLDGSVLPIKGVLPIAVKVQQEGFKGIILPRDNVKEAAVVDGLEVLGVDNICQVVDFFNGDEVIEPTKIDIESEFAHKDAEDMLDFADVKGQDSVKRAMEIAAAGGHNIILIGPPGAGKSMMAKRLPSILPPLSLAEALETTKIHSVAGKLTKSCALLHARPFRSPHHTISDIALVGGGAFPQPGEISLAHNGVLFLDEMPEFKRSVLEVMRQPLEDRNITVTRTQCSVEFPASFMLVASMNPCPCGYFNHPERECVCPPGAVQKYLNRISGPLMDRIDLHVEIVPLPFRELTIRQQSEKSEVIRERVIKARKIQEERYRDSEHVHCNAQMTPAQLRKYVVLDNDSTSMLQMAMSRLQLSARAYDRILKVARTIADLESSEHVLPTHISEAIGYRNLDRESWAR